MHGQRRLLTEKQTFSQAYYFTVGTNAILFSCFMAGVFTDQSLFLYIKLR